MNRTERLQRRLAVAIREAEDADRVWRRTLELPVEADDERSLMDVARRVHAVWRERERARAHVAELESRLRATRVRTRLTHLREGASFVRWHVRNRSERSPASR